MKVSGDWRQGMFMPWAEIEATLRKGVRQSGYERLISWFAASKPVATDLLLLEIELATHEPVRPQRIDLKDMTE